MNRRQRRQAKRAAEKRRKQAIAKDKRPRTDMHRKEQTVRGEPPKRTFRPLRWFWGGLLAAIAIVGFAYQFRPEINVDKDVSINVRDPFATQFRVTNEGLLAVYDLNFSCTVNNSMMRNVRSGGSGGQEPVSVLESKESATRNCSIKADSFPLLSHLFFDVTYRPKWYWSRSIKRTQFVNVRDSEGHLQWVKQPLDDPSKPNSN